MGAAKRRGTKEQRVTLAVAKAEAERKAKEQAEVDRWNALSEEEKEAEFYRKRKIRDSYDFLGTMLTLLSSNMPYRVGRY